jgi:uncharacterized protein YjbJ (UPF0337 family)
MVASFRVIWAKISTEYQKGTCAMSWDRIEGQWKQRRGRAVQHWGKMMNDELAAIAGKHEELVGRLQEKYGIAKEEAKEQVDLFKKTIEKLKRTNRKLMAMQKALIKQQKGDRKQVKSKAPTKKRTRSKANG